MDKYRHQSKVSSSKKFTCKGTLRQVFICLSYTTPPLHTVYVHVLIQREKGGEGGVEPERRGEGQQGRVQITKLSRKYQHD